VRLLVFSV